VEEASRRKASERTIRAAGGLQQAQSELRTQEVAMASREGEFKALQTSQRTSIKKIDTVVYEIQSWLAEEDRCKSAPSRQKASELEFETRLWSARPLKLRGLETLRQQRDAQHGLTEVKVAMVARKLCASLKHQQQTVAHRLRELVQLLEHGALKLLLFSTAARYEAEIESPAGVGSSSMTGRK